MNLPQSSLEDLENSILPLYIDNIKEEPLEPISEEVFDIKPCNNEYFREILENSQTESQEIEIKQEDDQLFLSCIKQETDYEVQEETQNDIQKNAEREIFRSAPEIVENAESEIFRATPEIVENAESEFFRTAPVILENAGSEIFGAAPEILENTEREIFRAVPVILQNAEGDIFRPAPVILQNAEREIFRAAPAILEYTHIKLENEEKHEVYENSLDNNYCEPEICSTEHSSGKFALFLIFSCFY